MSLDHSREKHAPLSSPSSPPPVKPSAKALGKRRAQTEDLEDQDQLEIDGRDPKRQKVEGSNASLFYKSDSETESDGDAVKRSRHVTVSDGTGDPKVQTSGKDPPDKGKGKAKRGSSSKFMSSIAGWSLNRQRIPVAEPLRSNVDFVDLTDDPDEVELHPTSSRPKDDSVTILPVRQKAPGGTSNDDVVLIQNGRVSTSTSTFTSVPSKPKEPLEPSIDPATACNLTCPICLGTPNPLAITACGHAMCAECLHAAMVTQQQPQGFMAYMARGRNPAAMSLDGNCPVCRTALKGGWEKSGPGKKSGGLLGLYIKNKLLPS